MLVLITINTLLFTAIAVLHFYWALGGEWAIRRVIPTMEGNKETTFRPPPIMTALVGFGLLGMAALTLANTGVLESVLAPKWVRYGTIAIGVVFLLRAIGDFKYVGFTKTVKDTVFAQNDSKLFSPLCLAISLISMGIVYLS